LAAVCPLCAYGSLDDPHVAHSEAVPDPPLKVSLPADRLMLLKPPVT